MAHMAHSTHGEPVHQRLEREYAVLVERLGAVLVAMHGVAAVDEDRLDMVRDDVANAANDALPTPQW